MSDGDTKSNLGPVSYTNYTPKKLKNRNNICYANAITQVLCIIPEFSNLVFDSSLRNDFDIQLKLLVKAIFANQNNPIKKRVSIESSIFMKKLIPSVWRWGAMQDASEFLTHILNTTQISGVSDIFKFHNKVSSICFNCNENACEENLQEENILMLSLDQENLINEIKLLLSKYLNYHSVDNFTCDILLTILRHMVYT